MRTKGIFGRLFSFPKRPLRWIGMPFVKVNEGTNSIQFVCPYCDKIDTSSTALNVLLSPPEYFVCPSCGKESRATAGTGLKGKTAL